MLQKINTYFWYFLEYLKHGDFRSVIASIRYLINKKSHSKDRIINSSIGKFYCRRNTNDFQFANFRYEWGVKRFFLKHISEFSLFIDAGSCVGIYAILSAKYKLPCIAFEPIPANFEVLKKNLELNRMSEKVNALMIGLGDQNRLVDFDFDTSNTGASHIVREHGKNICPVEIRTFDSLKEELKINKSDNILFKMDVEGMETEALLGAESFIQNHPKITFIIEDKFTRVSQIKSILDKYGRFEYGIIDSYNMFARKIG